MAQYSVFGPRASSSSQPFALDDFLPPQSGEEHEQFEMYSGDSGFSRAGPNGGGGRRPNGSILQQKAPPPSTAPNGGLPLLDGSVEEERVRDASLLILPLLLANPPSIPSHMKSTEVRQRHQLLSISPNDIDDYLVTPSPSSPSDVKSRVIAGLDALKGSVEQLAGILATDTDAMEHIVRTVRWASPEPGNVQANVLLGDDDAEHLALILKREEEPTGRREPWRFHNLLPAGEAPGNWCDDLARAQKRRAPTPPSKPSGLSVQWKDRDRAASNDAAGRSRSLTSNATTRTAGSYNTADEGEHEQPDDAPAEEKFTTADDFWGGWDDNVEGGEGEGDAGESREVIKQTAGADEAAAEAAYWASYDASDPHADSLRRDAEEAERQKQMDLDTVSQMGSVNFDGLERRMDHPASTGPGSDVYAVGAESALGGANEAIREEEEEDGGHHEEAAQEEEEQEGQRSMDSEHSRRSIDAVPPPLDSGSMPTAAYEKVQKMFDASQDTAGSPTGDRDAPMSPRSDATSMGLTDEGEQFTADNTTVDVEELDRAATGKPGAEEDGEEDGEQEGEQPFEPVAEEPDAEEREVEEDEEAGDDQEDKFVEAPTTPQPVPEDNHSSPRKTRKDMIGIEDLAAAQQRQQQPRKKGNNTLFPPAPMSVSGQSVFETPADMSLADLEAFYRSRDHQRMLEAKERLARMHRESRESMTEEKPKQHQHRAARGKSAGSDEEADEDSDHDSDIVSEAESALQEARSAIGSVMSEYTSAPSRSAESQQDKQHDTLQEEDEPAEDEDEEDDEDASNAPRRPSSSQVASRSNVSRSDADPLEALSQADPTLAFGLQDDRDGSGSEDEDEKRKRGRGRVPMTREVSMGTLRRLAEENQLEEDKKKGKKSGEETTTTSGLSRAGGFKNFLQLAPSTVATDLDSEEPLEMESEPHRPPSAIDEEEGEYEEGEDEGQEEDDGPQQQDEMEEQAAEAAQVPMPEPAGTDIGEQHDEQQDDDGGNADQSLAAFAIDPHATPRPRDSGGAYGKRRSKDAAPAGNDHDAAEEQEQDEGGEDDEYNDLDAFMFPDSHKNNKRALDSPGLSDNDPLAREAFGVITGRGIGGRGGKSGRGGGGDGRLSPSKFRLTGNPASTSGGAAPSESFLPGAASDASVRPLLGSIVGRNISDESGNTGVTRSTNMVRLIDPKRIVEEGNEDEEEEAEGEEEEQPEEQEQEQDNDEEQQQQQGVEDEGQEDEDEGERSFDSSATPRNQHGAGARGKPSASRSRSPTSTKATPGISSNTNDPSRPSSNAPLQRSASSRPAARNLPSTDNIGAASTSTDLGLAEIAGGGGDDQQSEKYSVAPGPQWVGAAPPPGSTSQHTANLRHQYLRQQRQQALQSQRERMQQQRGQRRGGGGGGGEDADTPAPLARGAQQRPPFPGAPGAGAGTRRPPGPPPNRRSRSSSGKMRDINGVPAAAAVTVGPATGEDEEEEEGEEEEEDDAARALYDQVKDLARDGGELDEGEEEEGEEEELPGDEDGEGQDEEQDQEGEANGNVDGQDDNDDEQAGLEANGDAEDHEDERKISSPPRPTPPLQHKCSNVSTSRHSDPQGQHNRSAPAPPPVPPSLPSPAAAMPPSPATPSTSLDPNRLSPTFTRPALNQRQQPDRLHASQAAHRRRLVLKALQRRNAQVESLLRGVVAIINDQGAEDDPHFAGAGGAGALPVMGESDFLRLAREAYRACEREKDERIANGAGGHEAGAGVGPRRGRAATADDPGAGMSGRDVMSGKAKGVVSGGGNRDEEDEERDENEDEAERAAMMPLAMGEGEDGEEGDDDGYDEEEVPEGIEAL